MDETNNLVPRERPANGAADSLQTRSPFLSLDLAGLDVHRAVAEQLFPRLSAGTAVPPVLTAISEPMTWESVVACVQFQGKNLLSISFRPIVLNYVGQGQPDIHDAYANDEFLDTRGLPSPVTGARAGYILQRLADASKPFGTTVEIKGDAAEIKLKAGN